jgi:hypothetical protein
VDDKMPRMGVKIIFAVLCLAILIQLCTGATMMNKRNQYGIGTITIRRNEQPAIYWGAIGFQCLVAFVIFLYFRHIIP